MRIKAAIAGIFACLFSSTPAWAYLDPGTASLALQGIIAGALSVAAITRLYWHRLKGFFGSDSSNAMNSEAVIGEDSDGDSKS